MYSSNITIFSIYGANFRRVGGGAYEFFYQFMSLPPPPLEKSCIRPSLYRSTTKPHNFQFRAVQEDQYKVKWEGRGYYNSVCKMLHILNVFPNYLAICDMYRHKSPL